MVKLSSGGVQVIPHAHEHTDWALGIDSGCRVIQTARAIVQADSLCFCVQWSPALKFLTPYCTRLVVWLLVEIPSVVPQALAT